MHDMTTTTTTTTTNIITQRKSDKAITKQDK